MLLNGLAKKSGITEKDVNPIALKNGIVVEMEHTDDINTAKEIALDHLSEDPNYYEKLKLIEGNKKMNLKKLLESKGKKVEDGVYKDAKMSMLKALMSAMNDDMGSHLEGLKKVTVASPNKEGLEEGLGKAKELLEESDEESEESSEQESESPEIEKSEDSEEEKDVDEEIAELEARLAQLKKNR